MESVDEKNEIESSNAQCPNCGSGLFYDPKTKGLKCKSCSSIADFTKSKENLKNPFVEGSNVENNEWAKESRVFHCDTCGAEVVVTGFDVTTNCPYCGSTYVSQTDQLPGLKPDRVVPFAFDEKDAVTMFAKGVKKKFFVPRVFKKCIPENKVRGLFVPTFTFDADTDSQYRGTLEKVTTTTDSKGNTHRKVRQFNIAGNVSLNFRELVVESSSKFDQKQMNSLLPYYMDEAYHFDSNFLRGYMVEHYQASLNDCYLDAKSKMDNDIRQRILSKYDYTSVIRLSVDTMYLNRLYSYSLFPVYSFEYQYKKKKYITIMNGQTGRIGKGLPISPLKVTITVLGVLIIIAAFIMLFVLLSES